MNVQISLILCDDCNKSREKVALVRKSHANSYWCEHAISDDWHSGRQHPLLITMVKT